MATTATTGSSMGRNAFSTVASASFGIVTGIVLDMLVVAFFGISPETDAYYIAITIPWAIITLLMLQATRVVQPVLIAKRQAEGNAGGWSYLNLVLTTGTAVVAAFCALGVLLSPLLMGLQVDSNKGDIALAIRLSISFFAILPLYFPIVVLRAALNSFDIFALPGAMKLIENTFRIFFVVVFGRKLGVLALVVGTLAGSLFQLGAFYFVLRRKGFRFKPMFRLKHPDMVQAYGLVGFQLTAQTAGVSVDVINNALATRLGEGSVTALKLAQRIIESFASLLPASVILAAMPTVATSVANGDEQATKSHLRRGFYLLLLVTLPLSIWLALVNRQLITLLYQRGNFLTSDTALVSSLLLLTIPYLLLGRFRSLFELPFFAEQNSRTPLLASVLESVVYVASSLLLVKFLKIYSLPAGRAIASVVGPCFLGYLLTRRLGDLQLRLIRGSLAKLCLACAVMAVFVLLGAWMSPIVPVQGWHLGPLDVATIVAFALPTATGFGALVISMFALGILDSSILDMFPPLRNGWLSRLIPGKYAAKS
jgi:putative peptidoglycan lipid II flippase